MVEKPLENAELDGIEVVTARRIVDDMDMTSVKSMEKKDDGRIKVELTVKGGLTAFGSPESRWGIKSVLATGDPETLTVYLVEKQV